MRKIVAFGATLAALALSSPAQADIPPLTPEGKLVMEKKEALENAVRARFSDATFNHVRDLYGSIVVAEEVRGSPSPPRVLIKDETGWHELRGRGRRELPRRIAHELDRLMITEALWREDPYSHEAACLQPRLFMLRHAGKEQFGRQCGVSGLAGRAAEVAATFRIPPGPARTTASPPDSRLSIGPQEDLASHIGALANEMVWAWERRSLAGAVEPYAADVIVEFADGRVLRGRTALVEWLRRQQDWSAPGRAVQGSARGFQYHRGVIKPAEKGIVTEMREMRWVENGRPLRRTYSANWRNNDGLWQIVYERVSADKAVTGERHVW